MRGMIREMKLKLVLLVFSAFVGCALSATDDFILDTFTAGPGIMNADPTCMSITTDGSISVTQAMDEYSRTTRFIMINSEGFPALGHDLCMKDRYLYKSSGPSGLSYFEITYDYYPDSYLTGIANSVMLLRIKVDLPQYVNLIFEFMDVNNATYKIATYLADFIEPETLTDIPIYVPAGITVPVKQVKMSILPPINNVDMRISMLDVVRTNFLQYRRSFATPANPTAFKAFDGNTNTSYIANPGSATQTTLEVQFPKRRFSKGLTLVWAVKPNFAVLAYKLMDDKDLVTIKAWPTGAIKNINTVNANEMPDKRISNFVLIIDGYGELAEMHLT